MINPFRNDDKMNSVLLGLALCLTGVGALLAYGILRIGGAL